MQVRKAAQQTLMWPYLLQRLQVMHLHVLHQNRKQDKQEQARELKPPNPAGAAGRCSLSCCAFRETTVCCFIFFHRIWPPHLPHMSIRETAVSCFNVESMLSRMIQNPEQFDLARSGRNDVPCAMLHDACCGFHDM